MTPEQLVPIIVKALREISPWPWTWGAPPLKHWPKSPELSAARFIRQSPLWLAQMVVEMVEERTHVYANDSEGKWDATHFIAETLRDFSLTEADWKWLKGKVEE